MSTQEQVVKLVVQNQFLESNDEEDNPVFLVHYVQMCVQTQQTTSLPRGHVVLKTFCRQSFYLSSGRQSIEKTKIGDEKALLI